VVVFDGVPHIVYVDRMARLREIWLDEQWRQHPLPAAPRPAGGVVILRSDSAPRVSRLSGSQLLGTRSVSARTANAISSFGCQRSGHLANRLFLTGSKEDNRIINSIVARETRSFGRGTTESVSAAWSQ